jgi:mono/diheme cytochrome c family protein
MESKMRKIAITTCLCFLLVIYLVAQKAQPALQATITRGKAVYTKWCMACHQKDGGGVPHLNPPLIKTTYVLGDKTRLTRIVLKGMNEPIEIEDEEYSNPMSPLGHLSDQEISDVLTYVRNSFGNKASAVTVAEVKAIRAKTK